MFCCDPVLVGSTSSFRNNKIERLVAIIEEIVATREKVLVFTSFLDMADIIQNLVATRFNIYCKKIDGRTIVAERHKILDEFTDLKESAVLVLNPKAAGSGLNITAANHVIHYNSEWNPAIEDQASARSYRRGQVKTVRIFKLFYAETIEEVMQERLSSKRQISQTAIVGVDGQDFSFTEILNALNVSPKR